MTRPHLTLTTQLIRLSKHPLGLKEAAILFASVDGVTAPELANAFNEHNDNIRGRLSHLMSKGLIRSEDGGGAFVTYHPTGSGLEVIKSAYTQTP